MEIWKDILGFENYYQISNFGNVRSKDRLVKSKNNSFAKKIGKIKKAAITNGYKTVLLSKENTEKGIGIHRLVALHFIPNPLNKKEVNHIDDNKLNNDLSNLEWATSSENSKHSYDNGLQISRKGSKHHFAKINELDVLNMFILFKNGISKKDISKQFSHISYSSVCRILKGKTWKHTSLIEQGLAVDINTIKL